MSDRLRQDASQGGGQNLGGRPLAPWHTETFELMVRSMRAAATPDPVIASILFPGEGFDERIVKRLDRAERKLPRNARNARARQALGIAWQKMGEADSREDALWRFIRVLRAMRTVLEAEPDEYRDWLPEFIRRDPVRQMNAEIGRTVRELTELRLDRLRRPCPAPRDESTQERRRRLAAESLSVSQPLATS